MSGTILTSNDGTTKDHLFAVTYANNQYIVVGANGIILSSSDGITWIPQTVSPPLVNFRAIT